MRGGSSALWRIQKDGKQLERLTSGNGPESHPSLTPSGREIAYTTFVEEQDVVILDRKTGLRTRLPSSRLETNPDVAPDGSAVVFVSNMLGKYDIWLQPLAKGRPFGARRRLTDHPGSVATPTFSSDNRWIAYFRVHNGRRDIWLTPVTGGMPSQITDHPAPDVQPSFSPHNDRLAFVSARDGLEHIWLIDIVDGERRGDPWRLTKNEEIEMFPTWSPDAHEIAFISAGDVWRSTADGKGKPIRVTTGAQAHEIVWVGTGETILVSGSWGTARVELRAVNVQNGRSSPLDHPVVFCY
jgi:TolB protein